MNPSETFKRNTHYVRKTASHGDTFKAERNDLTCFHELKTIIWSRTQNSLGLNSTTTAIATPAW